MEINDTKPLNVELYGWSTTRLLPESPTSSCCSNNNSDLNKERNRLSIAPPAHELKSISLVKSTHHHLHHQENNNNFHYSSNLADMHKLTQNISADNTTIAATKFKNDLDEAFRDLLNVSASLKQMAERSPLGYSSFRRHSIDNVLDDEPERQPADTSDNLRTNNVIPTKMEKPVPAPRRKLYTASTIQTDSDTVEVNQKESSSSDQRASNTNVTGRVWK